MAEEKSKEASSLNNKITDGTGQFDARFVLWRSFCADNGVAIETLPGDLKGEVKDRWEKLKAEKLQGNEKT